MLSVFLVFSASLITDSGNRDFYKILNITNDAENRKIDRTFQLLSRKYHPDKNKGNQEAAEKYTDINDAYGVLRNRNRRRIYDLFGEKGVHILDSPSSEFNPLYGLKVEEMVDLFQIRIHAIAPTLVIPFYVDLKDFYYGAVYSINISRRTMCRCPRKGFICDKCKGRPTIRETVRQKVVVERSTPDRSLFTIKEAGDESEVSAAGDLSFDIICNKHENLTRVGDDLHASVSVTLLEYLTGFERKIPHIDGTDIVVNTDMVAEQGTDLLFKGRGMPRYLLPDEYGDLIVHVNVVWPESLDQDTRARIAHILQ